MAERLLRCIVAGTRPKVLHTSVGTWAHVPKVNHRIFQDGTSWIDGVSMNTLSRPRRYQLQRHGFPGKSVVTGCPPFRCKRQAPTAAGEQGDPEKGTSEFQLSFCHLTFSLKNSFRKTLFFLQNLSTTTTSGQTIRHS